MATKGSEILSYNADPRIGLGSTSAIPVSTSKDLQVVNRTGENLMLANMAQNKALFDQKVRDRDKMLQAIDSGDIKVGDLLEEDTPVVKEGLEKLDQAWEDMIKRGVNDLDAQRTYKKALRDAQDRVTQAQGRKLFYDQESQELSKETLPRKQEARKKNLEGVIKGGFWKDITPYQQTLDLDFDPIKGYVKKVTTEETDPNNPLIKIKKTTADIDSTLNESKKDFLENDNNREYQIGLLNAYQNLDPQELKDWVEAANNRLKPLGSEIKTTLDPNGKIVIHESVPDFAAKWALASDPQLQSSSSEYDKGAIDAAELGLKKQKVAQDWKALGLREREINKADGEDLLGADAVLGEISDVIKNGTVRRVDNFMGSRKSKEVLEIGDPQFLKNFGSIDKDGKITNTPDKILYDKDKNQLYLQYYVTNKITGLPEKTSNGMGYVYDNSKTKTVNPTQWISQVIKTKFPNKNIGTINSLIEDVYNKAGRNLVTLSDNYLNKNKNSGEAKSEKYPLPKGKPEQVKQGEYTYTWNPETGQYE